MNSTGALSPAGRDADTLVAGNALGEMMMDVRFRVLLMTSDAIDTAGEERRVSAERRGQGRRQQGQRRDSHRFWSLRKSAAPSSGLLETLPMVKRQGLEGRAQSREAGRGVVSNGPYGTQRSP